MTTKTTTQTTNRILLAAALLLLALSAFTYRDSVQRADRFERGQKFLPHLDTDQIAEIVLREGGADDADHVLLRRSSDGDRFVVQSSNGYRADNAEVNRLLRALLDVKLEKEVGEASASLGERLGLARGEDGSLPEGTLEVSLRDASEQELVHFLVGHESEGDAAGRYLLRLAAAGPKAGGGEGGTIYVTQGRVDLRADGDSYLDKEIVNVPRTEVTAIRGDGFAFVRADGGDLTLEGLAGGRKESSKASSVKGLLSPLRVDTVSLADSPEVRDLHFTRSLTVELADGSGYVVELARAAAAGGDAGDDAGDAYVRVSGFTSTEKVLIDRDASEDEVRETSRVLVRADEIAEFNEYHGSWIYGVTDTVADRLDFEASDLVDG